MQYSFLTTWLLRTPREPVFEAIYDEASWPEWWRGVEVAEDHQVGKSCICAACADRNQR